MEFDNMATKHGAKTKDTQEFTWITSELPADLFLTVDKFRRIYFSTDARNLIGVEYSREIFLGYDFANKRMIVANPNTVRPTNVKPHKIDRRGYASARQFVKTLEISKRDLPLRFRYIGKDYTVRGAYAFEMFGTEGEDGGL